MINEIEPIGYEVDVEDDSAGILLGNNNAD
jgi:hypothetical protein